MVSKTISATINTTIWYQSIEQSKYFAIVRCNNVSGQSAFLSIKLEKFTRAPFHRFGSMVMALRIHQGSYSPSSLSPVCTEIRGRFAGAHGRMCVTYFVRR